MAARPGAAAPPLRSPLPKGCVVLLYDLYHAAKGILHDECPERGEYRLCDFAEDDQCADCTMCWEQYLLALLNEGLSRINGGAAAKG